MKNRINLAGEFYALHKLLLKGYDATFTLGNTKKVDILMFNPNNKKHFRVEVKASRKAPKERLFGKNMAWLMNEKHETYLETDNDLVYFFVFMPKDSSPPICFIVPSKDVASYVTWENEQWRKYHSPKSNKMRKFRIPLDGDSPYKDNFQVFE